ncbi:MAG: hypothetical protein AB7F40_01170 [Victivallaceae bacterium]|nr:hypothetical protein [Victivallaceae bacterium]
MGNYLFLMSSLPVPEWGAPLPIAVDAFRAAAADQLTSAELAMLDAVTLLPSFDGEPDGLARRFAAWDTCLRNALVGARTSGGDAAAYCKHEDDFFSEIPGVVGGALGSGNPLEVETTLDRARWDAIDMLLGGRNFCFDALAAYKLKLALLEKYAHRTAKQGEENLSKVLAAFENKDKE